MEIERREVKEEKIGENDVVIIDKEGRKNIDEKMMVEMEDIRKEENKNEIMIVEDRIKGKEEVNMESNLDESVGIKGIVIKRMDGDGRGGDDI